MRDAGVVLSLVLTLGVAFRAAGADAYEDKFVDSLYKDKLPAGYTVKREYYPNDTHLQSLTPLNAQGKPDGEAMFIVQYGWEPIRTIPYSNGLQEGVEKEYAYAPGADGKQARYLRKETTWKAGKLQAAKKLYHPNGRVMTETNYIEGVADGASRSSDLSGRLEREAIFKNGKQDGPLTEYWPLTGKPKKIIPYKMGKVEGLTQEFYDNGKPRREIFVKNEEFQGMEKRFDEDGNLVKTIYWLHDKEVSKKEYDEKK